MVPGAAGKAWEKKEAGQKIQHQSVFAYKGAARWQARWVQQHLAPPSSSSLPGGHPGALLSHGSCQQQAPGAAARRYARISAGLAFPGVISAASPGQFVSRAESEKLVCGEIPWSSASGRRARICPQLSERLSTGDNFIQLPPQPPGAPSLGRAAPSVEKLLSHTAPCPVSWRFHPMKPLSQLPSPQHAAWHHPLPFIPVR